MSDRLRSSWLCVLAVVAACGTQVEPPQEGTDESSTGVNTTDSTVTATSSTGAPPPSTSTTGVTTTGVDSSSGDETDDNFIMTPDAICIVNGEENWHCSFECDPFVQDCAEGEKCVPWANDGGSVWNGLRCVPVVDSPGQVGEPCTIERTATSGFDDCALGAVCLGVDETTLEGGTCVAQCTGSQQEPGCAEGTSCLIANDGSVTLCLPDCDPLAGDCGADETCTPHEEYFVCLPTASDVAPAGAPCETPGSCDPGAVCLPSALVGAGCDLDAFGCCTPWCDLGAVDPTAGCLDKGQECQSWWKDMPPAEFADVGVCMLPAP